MVFAYKLTSEQQAAVRTANCRNGRSTDRYDIQARATGNPTKDQYRLMMQALLADRFKLAIHYETKQIPVFALVLDKPGKLGPQLQPHPSDAPCSTAPPARGASSGLAATDTLRADFPEICGAISRMQPSAPGRFRDGARNMSLADACNNI